MDNVSVFGSTGQLGTDLVEVLQSAGSYNVFPSVHETADCRDAQVVRSVICKHRPRFVINCAAYVRVDDCEDHPDEAFAVNAIGALNIARACAEVDACCVYISTDYVFNGTKGTPYTESDPTDPINVYGTSKLAGELLVRQAASRWLIVRTSSLFGKTGARGKGGNFIESILTKARRRESLKVVDDILVSPTYTRHAAQAIGGLLAQRREGIVHVANTGVCSWFELACRSIELCRLDAEIGAVSSNQYPMRAKRPRNSALRSDVMTPAMTSWQEALVQYLGEKGYLH